MVKEKKKQGVIFTLISKDFVCSFGWGPYLMMHREPKRDQGQSWATRMQSKHSAHRTISLALEKLFLNNIL